MSEINPLNDPELNDLEQRLTAVMLAPTSHQRERLLYACGHAAGRAQVMRRVRVMSAATVMLACISAGLSFLLLTDTSPKTKVMDPTGAPVVEGERTDLRINLLIGEQQKFGQNRGWHLSAGTSFDQLLIFEKLRKAEPLNTASPGLSSKRVLTVASRSWPDDLWE